MTVFAYGATLGLVVSFILGKRVTTINHPKYRSDREAIVYTLLGAVFLWVLFPGMIFNSLDSRYFTPFTAAGPIGMWFALSGSVIATFAISIFLHHRIGVHDVVFGSFAGAISFATSSSLVYNPVAPIVVGIFSGTVNTLLLSGTSRKINANGVINTNPVIETFLIGGICGGLWSALFATFQGGYVDFSASFPTYSYPIDRTNFKQGGLQVAGTFISVGIAIILGIIAGLIIFLMNKNTTEDQFDDGTYWTIEDYGLQKDIVNH